MNRGLERRGSRSGAWSKTEAITDPAPAGARLSAQRVGQG